MRYNDYFQFDRFRSRGRVPGKALLPRTLFLGAIGLAALIFPWAYAFAERRPNIVLILTDDQGYGDLGFTGNPLIYTPNLDRFACQSVFLSNFCVSPVCTPTRASLMTGRYNYRTRAIDTYRGRAMMDPGEVTLAEVCQAAGYRTGIFGKWHLGDCYPLRAMDQGFEESLVLRGGGLSQPSDYPESKGYFDPILMHNGQTTQTHGYCSDIFTEAAIKFIEQNQDHPFFVYLPFNAPHEPLQVPERYYQMYKDKIQSASEFPTFGYPQEAAFNADDTARLYGMVTNIDDNVGRLLARLDELQLAEDTVVVFLTDNGPQRARFRGGFRGLKGSVYEGGIRVPCFMRWKGHLPGGRQVDLPLAHIDMAPTLEELCGLIHPATAPLDGLSFAQQMTADDTIWPRRTLFFQWHRGDQPELFRAFSARGPRYKLVQALGNRDEEPLTEHCFELFDLAQDPYEMTNLAGEHPEIVEELKQQYETWFKDVSASRGYGPPRIQIGGPHARHVSLTRQDWRGAKSEWRPDGLGSWEVQVTDDGSFDLTMLFDELPAPGRLKFKFGATTRDENLPAGVGRAELKQVPLKTGSGQIEAWIESGEKQYGVRFVDLRVSD